MAISSNVGQLQVRITGSNELDRALNSALGSINRWSAGLTAGANTARMAVGNLIGGLTAATAAAAALKGILEGIRINAALEQSRLGMAALLLTANEITDATGKRLEKEREWQAALHLSTEMQKELMRISLQIGANYEEMTYQLQTVIQGSKGVFDPRQMVEFTRAFNLATKAFQMPEWQALQEIRAFFEGRVDPQSRITSFLFGDLVGKDGGPRKLLRELKKDGDELFKWAMERLRYFEQLSDKQASSLEGRWRRLKNAVALALAEGTGPGAKAISELLEKWIQYFVVIDEKTNSVDFNPRFVQNVKSITDMLVKAADAVGKIAAYTNERAQRGSVGLFVDEIVPPGIQPDWMKQYTEGNPSQVARRLLQLGRDAWSTFTRNFTNRWAPFQLGNMGGTMAGFGVDRYGIAQYEDANAHILEYALNPRVKPGEDEEDSQVTSARKAVEDLVLALQGKVRTHEAEAEVLKRLNDGPLKDYAEYQKKLTEAQVDQSGFVDRLKEAAKYLGQSHPMIQTALKLLNQLYDSSKANAWAQFNKDLNKGFGEAFGDRMKTETDRALERMRSLNEGYLRTVQLGEQERIREIERNRARYEQAFARPFTAALQQAAARGGSHMAEVFMGMLANYADVGLGDLMTRLGDALGRRDFGDISVGSDGKYYYAVGGEGFDTWQQAVDARNAQSPTARRVGMGIQAASTIAGAYGLGRTGQSGSQTAGLMQGALSGASIGMYWGGAFTAIGAAVGAIIGAVVGWAVAAMGKAASRRDYKYGIFDVEAGTAHIRGGGKNLRDDEVQMMTARVQDTFDTFWNAYINILINYGSIALPEMIARIDGKFQRAASKNYLKHFEEWITNTLPREIAGYFEDSLRAVYTGLGLTTQRFNEFADTLNKLDPKKALELWDVLGSALKSMQDIESWYFPGGGDYGTSSFSLRMGNLAGKRAWGAGGELHEMDTEIIKLAQSLDSLVGEEQIRAAQRLGQLMNERMQREIQFMQQLLDLSESVNRTIDGMVREYELALITNPDGTPNVQGQIDYLKAYGDSLLQQIAGATTPEQLNFLQGELGSVIRQIVQLGGTLGPDTMRAYLQWGIDAAEAMREAINLRIRQLGDSVQGVDDKLWESLRPVWERFKGIVEDSGTAFDDFTGGLSGAGSALDGFTARIQLANEALDGIISDGQSKSAAKYTEYVKTRRVMAQ